MVTQKLPQHQTQQQSPSSSSTTTTRMRMQNLIRFMETILRRICLNPCCFLVSKIRGNSTNDGDDDDHPIFAACEMMPPTNVKAVRDLLLKERRSCSDTDDDDDDASRLSSILHTTRRQYDGATPLHVAVTMQDIELVRFLLDGNNNNNNDYNTNYTHSDAVSATDNEGQTPLHIAALNGNCAIVRMLVETHKKNNKNNNNDDDDDDKFIDIKTHKGHTAFFLACWRNRLDVVQYLHHEGGADVQFNLTIIDYEGQTLINRVKEWNQIRIIGWLDEFQESNKCNFP